MKSVYRVQALGFRLQETGTGTSRDTCIIEKLVEASNLEPEA
jgi:hypothetical protein